MTKHEMEHWILSMSYKELCKYIFKKNMDEEIKNERRQYVNGDMFTNEKIAEYLVYGQCSLEDIIDGINKFKQDCANKFEVGEVVKTCVDNGLGIVFEIFEDPYVGYKVLKFLNVGAYNRNFKFETAKYRASELEGTKKRKIYKDIKKIVEMGAITDD